ncbi:hypothetical protein [Corynebacterium sp.]|jgi:hypothetical protein|uniref:hypothetical protein n=1 Tax=Corynebacterium sp. TaxID=1720 RepID=UPI0025BB2CDF|nr:hypothetical protein [Corynebacterium sp.]
MDRDVMVFTRWIRLVALLAATVFMVVTGGTVGYIFAVVCVAFLGMTVWQLLKLYRDERYRT